MSDPVIAQAESLLELWQAGVNKHNPQTLGSVFADDVLFAATAPEPLQGLDAVLAYYAKAPNGLTAQARILSASEDKTGLRIVAAVRFSVPVVPSLRGALTLATRADGVAQRISLYHACLSPDPIS